MGDDVIKRFECRIAKWIITEYMHFVDSRQSADHGNIGKLDFCRISSLDRP
jgi:hypothetical protein